MDDDYSTDDLLKAAKSLEEKLRQLADSIERYADPCPTLELYEAAEMIERLRGLVEMEYL